MSMPDAELIELGRELAVWWAAERAADLAVERGGSNAAAEAISDAASALVDRIMRLEATSIEGLKTKALAVSWCHGGDDYNPDVHTTDEKVVLSMVKDLLRMCGPALVPPLAV